MTGLKLKLAHKRANSEKWSSSEIAQKKRLQLFLQDIVEQLEEEIATFKTRRKKLSPQEVQPVKRKPIMRKIKKASKRKTA